MELDGDIYFAQYPDEFAMAEKICDEIAGMIKHIKISRVINQNQF